MKGYKARLSDKIPEAWDIALRYYELRTWWLAHTYKEFVSIYCDNKNKSFAVDVVITGTFHDSINWDNVGENEVDLETVETWANWLQKHLVAIKDSIKSYEYRNLNLEQAVVQLVNDYNLKGCNNITRFILNYLQYGQ